jgi:hypothetical protein
VSGHGLAVEAPGCKPSFQDSDCRTRGVGNKGVIPRLPSFENVQERIDLQAKVGSESVENIADMLMS